ncbi:MAG: CDP-glycerol glycerophosphotransferase family protein [Ectothiorhodospiraceae bacterium]|nr:CDP-glycerol glycerophosphotransferase family protein [Ectothiorhodospiraceae bacterium]MBN4053092.1 CDP-glycerol glycerophosphotransferase family protein [Gammaproteobacteria bacterium AH-315-K14]
MPQSVYFDIPHLYYLPQYQPVYDELKRRGAQCTFVFYEKPEPSLLLSVIEQYALPVKWVKDEAEALALYREDKPHWVIFGNDFLGLKTLDKSATRCALLFHGSGTGVKGASLSPGLGEVDVRFVSGPARLPIFRELYPTVELVTVGFAKLDPLFGPVEQQPTFSLSELGLDPDKKTLLYAPTFYPSSIENMGRDWPKQFAEYNILIKPHDFTLNKKRYAHPLKRLHQWAQYDNVWLAKPTDYSLIPFMATADVMATDTSSAIFEFASLDKPVIVCDFVRLRWSYRGPFRYRLRKRLDASTEQYQDIATHAKRFKDLKSLVDQQMQQPGLLSTKRLEYAEKIMGQRDGKVAVRIVDFLLKDHSTTTR